MLFKVATWRTHAGVCVLMLFKARGRCFAESVFPFLSFVVNYDVLLRAMYMYIQNLIYIYQYFLFFLMHLETNKQKKTQKTDTFTLFVFL